MACYFYTLLESRLAWLKPLRRSNKSCNIKIFYRRFSSIHLLPLDDFSLLKEITVVIILWTTLNFVMKASTERKIIRWIHIILSIPIIGYIYGPVANIPEASMMVRVFFFPVIVLSGLYLWKGHLLKKWWRRNHNAGSTFQRLKKAG